MVFGGSVMSFAIAAPLNPSSGAPGSGILVNGFYLWFSDDGFYLCVVFGNFWEFFFCFLGQTFVITFS